MNPATTGACRCRTQPAVRTLGLTVSNKQRSRDPWHVKGLSKPYISVSIFMMLFPPHFLLNLHSYSQPWLTAASASSVPGSWSIEERTQKITQTWVQGLALTLASSETSPLGTCHLMQKAKRKSPTSPGCCKDSKEQLMWRYGVQNHHSIYSVSGRVFKNYCPNLDIIYKNGTSIQRRKRVVDISPEESLISSQQYFLLGSSCQWSNRFLLSMRSNNQHCCGANVWLFSLSYLLPWRNVPPKSLWFRSNW